MTDQDRLLDLASAVVGGTDVNWDDEERAGDPRERSIVREMRVLAEIAEVARHPSSHPTDPRLETPGAAHPESWGHLRLLNQVGHGSFGTVYRAWDRRLEREVALKLVPSSERTAFDVSRAVKEARILARVRHPHVVAVLGADCHDGRFGLWMEYISGRTLEDLVAANGTFSAGEAAAIGVDLCHALAAVHHARLLHRDVKASNVMREKGGRIVLMDFGAGRRMPSADDPVDPLAGTPLYLAPELMAGEKPSIASDVYSLGVLVFHLVTGGYPVTGGSRQEVADAHRREHRVSLRDARPDLPSAFADAVERALSPDPRQRYTTAGAFGAALAAVSGVHYERDPVRWPQWKLMAAAAIVTVAVGVAVVPTDAPDTPVAPAATTAPAPGAYEIMAAFYAARDGQQVRLTAGSHVSPGDRIYLTLDSSRPVYVYVVNQDDAGNAFLLFPLAAFETQNPVPAGGGRQLPGLRGGEPFQWQVTTAGGREHFLVFAAVERMAAFEEQLAALPVAEDSRPVEGIPLSPEVETRLRGVGGIVRREPASLLPRLPGFPDLQPLPDTPETASGVWARRITFENPAR